MRQYRLSIPKSDIESLLDAEWGNIVNELEARGVPKTNIPKARTDAITVDEKGAGIGWVDVLIAFAPLITKVLGDVWDAVVKPKIEKKYGKDALKALPPGSNPP